jgi:trimeric autotransporter adhesin
MGGARAVLLAGLCAVAVAAAPAGAAARGGVNRVETAPPASSLDALLAAAKGGGAADGGGKTPMSPALADLIGSLTRKRLNRHIAAGILGCLKDHVHAGDSILRDGGGRMPGQPWEDYTMAVLLERHPGVLPLVACMGLNNLIADEALAAAGSRLVWAAVSGLGLAGTADAADWLAQLLTRVPSPLTFTLGGHLLERVDPAPVASGSGSNGTQPAAPPLLSVFGASPDGFGVLHKALDRDKRLLQLGDVMGRLLVEMPRQPPKERARQSAAAGASAGAADPADPDDDPYGSLQWALGFEALFDSYGLGVDKAARAVLSDAARRVTQPAVVPPPWAARNGTAASPPAAAVAAAANATAAAPSARVAGRILPAPALAALSNALSVWALSRVWPNVAARRDAALASAASDGGSSRSGGAAGLADALLSAPHLVQLLGARDVLGRTPLHVAAVTGNAAAVGQLHTALLGVLVEDRSGGSGTDPRMAGAPERGSDSGGAAAAAATGAAWWPHAAAVPWLTDVAGYTPRALAAAHGHAHATAALEALETGVAEMARLRAREGVFLVPGGVCRLPADAPPGGADAVPLVFTPAAAGPAGLVPPEAAAAAAASPCPPYSTTLSSEDEAGVVSSILQAHGGSGGGSSGSDAEESSRAFIEAKRRRNRKGRKEGGGGGGAPPRAAGDDGSSADEEEAQAREATTQPRLRYVFNGPDFAGPYNAPLAAAAAAAAAAAGDAATLTLRPAAPVDRRYASSLAFSSRRGSGGGSAAAGATAADADAAAVVVDGASFPVAHVSEPAAAALAALAPDGAAAGAAAAGACDVDVLDFTGASSSSSAASASSSAPAGDVAALTARWLSDYLVPGRPVLLRGLLQRGGGEGAAAAAAAAVAPGGAAALSAVTPGALAAHPVLSATVVKAGAIPFGRRLGLSDVGVPLGGLIAALAGCAPSNGTAASSLGPLPEALRDALPPAAVTAARGLCATVAAALPSVEAGGAGTASPSAAPAATAASASASPTLKSGKRKKKGSASSSDAADGSSSGSSAKDSEEYDSVYAGARGGAAAGSRLFAFHRLRYLAGAAATGGGGGAPDAALARTLLTPLAFALNASLPAWRGPCASADAAALDAAEAGGGAGGGAAAHRRPPAAAARRRRLSPLLPLVDVSSGGGEPPSVYVFLGGPGSGQPVTAASPGGGETDRLSALAAGGATWLLQPPQAAGISSLPIADHVLQLAAAAAAAGSAGGSDGASSLPLRCAQAPGDVLYVPRGWAAGSLHTGAGLSSGWQVELVTPLARY